MGANAEGKISLSVELQNFKNIAGNLKKGLTQELKQIPLDVKFDNKDLEEQAAAAIVDINKMFTKTKLKNLDFSSILPAFVNEINRGDISDATRLQVIEGFKTGLENLKEGGLKQSYTKLKGFSADDLMNYFLDSNTAEDILNSFKGLSKRQKQGLRSSVLPSLSELKGRGWDAADKEYTKGAKRLEALMKLSGDYGDVLQYGTNPTATKNIISELDKRFKSGNMSKNDAQDVIGYLLRSDFLGINIKEELKNQETDPADLMNEAKNILGDSANIIIEKLKERAQAFFTAYDNIFNSTAKKITYKELLENIENTTNKKFLGLYNAEASNVLEEIDVGKLFKESVKIKSDEKPELRKRKKKEDIKDTTRTKPYSEEELKEFEFDDEEKEVQNLEEEINEITKKLEEIRNKIDENIQRRQQLENEIKNQEDLVGKKNKAYLDFKNDYNKYTVSARNAKYESDALKGTVENLDNQLEEEKQNKEKIEKKYNELIAKREAIKKEIEEKEKKLNTILPSIEQQETDLEKQLADLVNKKTEKQKEVEDKEIDTKKTLSLQDEWLEWYDEALQKEYKFEGSKAKSEAFEALKRLGNKYLEFKKNPNSSTATDKEAEAASFAVKHYKLWQAAKEAGVAESRLERERFDTDDDLAYKQAVDYLQQQRNHTEDFKKQIEKELELSKAELDKTKKEIQEITEKQKQLQAQKKQLLGDLRRKPAEKEDSNEADIRREKTKLDSSNSKIQKIEEQKRIADNQLKETEQYLERNELTSDRETQYKNQLQRLEEENNIQEKILQEKREELEKEIEEKDRLIRLGQELASKQDLLIEQQKKAKEKQEELNREKEEKRKQEELNRRQEEERRKQANESEASSKEENQTEKSQSSKTEETTDIGTTTSISPEKLQEILTLLSNIQKALGTLEDGSDVPSITQSVKNMADALKELNAALGEIKQKDFNFNIGLPNNNPIGQQGEVKRKILKELEKQYNELDNYYTNKMGYNYFNEVYKSEQNELIEIDKTREGVKKWVETSPLNFLMENLGAIQDSGASMSKKIEAYKNLIDKMRSFASRTGDDINNIISSNVSPDEIINKINEDISKTNPVSVIQDIFKQMQVSIDASMAQINTESKGFNFLSGSAEEAAEAKRKFVEANKDVLQSIVASMPKIEQEAEALEKIANQKNKRGKKENKNSDLKDEVKTEEKKNEELLKFQEVRNKVFEQGYSAQLDQQKKEEKIAQKQFQTALEQSRLQEQVNNFNKNNEITSKYNKGLTLDQGRQFQLDEQKKKVEQAKKLTQTELEQNRLTAQIEQVQKERSLKIKKTLEQNRESQLDEQIKKAEQAKKLTQIELEQARLAGQYDQASVMRQKKEQEQLKKEQDIKEYEKQFNNWNEEENGQLTFLDKNTHDLTEEYKKAVQEEIVHAQEVAEREAKSNPINIPLEGQISFTSNEDIDQIMKIYSDKGRQQAEKQFAKMRRSNEYINSETNIEKYLKPYENLSYGIEPTKYISELADVSSKIQDVKTELESSFDSEGKMVGNPLRIQELFKQYDALVLKVKELKAIISSPTSQENIALELAKEAEKAKEKVKETKEELDELKNKITSTFDVGRSDEILTSKTEAFIKSYGSLSDKNDINTLTNPIEGSGFEEQQSKVIALREELKKYKEAVEELKQLKNSDIVDLNTLTEADKKVKNLETSINAMMKSIRASGTPNASTSQVDRFARQIEAFMIKNPRITLEAKNSLNEYLQTLKSGESISKTALGAMADGFAKVKIEQEQAGKLGYNIWDQMVLKMREGVAFLATKFSFYQIFNQFRQGITIVKEFDDALTEMQKVSDETMLTLQRYQKTTFDVAESIGSTALQVQQSTADFLRLGESLEEAAKSAKAANVLMNVSEFESINDATTSLIALSAAYNDLTKENIIDKLNEVGNNYSISTSGAAEALQMSASALKTAQNDMNESLALVTAGNQVVQDISKAGNGLRTIALRLTGTKSAKEELEEMGEETENVITTQSKLRDVIKEATAVESNAFKGFDILDDNGNYKSTYEIMLGIAQIYDEIVETDKKLGRNNVNLLLETVAGKTRANVAASIFQSPDVLQKAYASSVSANGSAQEENQKYLESISGHLAQLQSKWQEVWSKTANREIINFFIDLGKGILDVVDKIGLIPSALAVIIPYFELIRTGATNSKGVITILLEALSTLNEVEEASNAIKTESETISLLKAASTQVENEALRQQIEACIEAAVAEEAKNTVGKESTALSLLKKASLEIENEELKEAIANYIQLAEAESLEAGVAGSTKASKEVGLLASRFDLLKKAAIGAKTAIVGALGPTGAIIATIGVVLAGAATAVAVANNHIREEAIANAKEATDTLNKQDESLQKQIASYEELKTKLDSGELSEQETLQTKQQIYDIQKQITEEYGTAAQGVDLVNGKLEKQVALLNSIGQKEALSLYNKNYEGYEAAIDEYTKDRKYGFSLSSGSKVIQDALSEAGLNVYGSGSGTFMAQIKDDAEGSIKSLEKARANLEKLQSEYKDTDTAKIIDNEIKKIDKAIGDAYEDADEYRDEALKGLELRLLSKNQKGFDTYQNYQSSVSDLESAYISGDTKKIDEARKAFEEATIAKDKFLNVPSNNQFSLLFDNIDTSLIDTKNQIHDATEAVQRATEINTELDRINNYKEQKKQADAFYDSLGNVQKVGNIDNGNRPIIFWDNKELKKQQKAIESWGETIEDFQGSMSTVYGGSGNFDGVEIAFTPIINDGTGKGKLLNKETLYKYIDTLIGNAGEGWTNESLLKLDAEGLVVDGQKISNVLGAVGNSMSNVGLTAVQVGELMHDWQSGSLGYISEFKNEWQEAIEQGESLEEHMRNRERDLLDTSKATDKYTKKEIKLAKALREVTRLDMDRVDAEMVFDENAKSSEAYSNALYNLMDALGWASDAHASFIDWAVDVGLIQGTVTDALDAASVSYNDYAQAVSTATENLALLQTVLTESDSGKGLSTTTLDQFKTAFGDDAVLALEKTANGIRVNRDAIRELGAQQDESLRTTQLQALNDQYTALQKVYEGYENALHNGDPTTPFIQQEEAIRNEINNLELLQAEWRGTTSAYQAWLNAQSNSNPQDMYANVISGYETVEDLIARGWWTDESVRNYLDLVLADDFDAQIAGANELKEGFESLDKTIQGTSFSIHDFFMTDESGNIVVDGLNNFEDALKQVQEKYYPDKNWLTYEDGNAIFDFRNGGNKEVADALGIGTELLDIIISAMESAGGFEVKLDTDDARENLKQLKEEAINAKDSLEDSLNLDEEINLNPANIKEADESINSINTAIEEIKNNDEIDLETKTDQLEEANKILEYLIENKNQLIQSSFGEKGIHLIDIGELDAVNNKLKEILNRPVKGGFDFSEFDFDTVKGLTAAQDAINNMVATPNVDDSQIQYLNELLDVITEKLGIINGIGSGASLTLGEYKALDETVTSVKQQIQEGQDAANKGFHISWSSDEDFYNTLDAINNLDPEIKTAFGLIPDKTTEELMDMVENGETIFVETKTTGVTPAPVQDETRTINTQENVTLGVTTVGADAAHSLIQEFEEKNGTESTMTLNATSNVSETKQEIEETQQASNELGESQPDVTATLNDKATSPLLALGNLADSIDGKSATIWSFYKDPNDAQGKIRYIAEHVYDRKQTITTEYKTTGSAPKGTGTINGTAHAQGTAFARGSIVSGNAFTGGKWGIPQNQTALTGELGTEIVVRDGNWFTVGEDGAEFVDLQKGDIVFNHKQAQELLENGYVTSNKGRGKLIGFANGSAFYRGTMLSGPAYGGDSAKRQRTTSSVATKQAGKKTTKKTTTGKGSGGGGGGKGNGGGGGTTNKEANKTKNTLDEVEILIARIERQIANLDKTISSTYKTWTTRNNAIKSDLAKVAQEIKDQNKAYTTYIKKANSVGLNATWKKKVQSGKFKIEDVTDDKLWQKIQDYKTYYEKALAAKDAVIDLKEKEGELYKQRFDNEQAYYEELIGDLEHTKNLLESYNDTLSESGKLGSQLLIRNQIAKENENIRLLNKEYNSLIARRNEAVKSGKIKKYSEAWYEMEQSIQEVSESIVEAQNNVITLGNNIRQLDWDRWDKIHDAIGGVNNELEFLYDLFNSDDFFDDQGNLTDQGVTAFALLAQQYDTYFREAQEYQKEIEATEALLSANNGKDKYDQNLVDKLKDLKEAQQDSISNAKKMKESMVDLTEDGIKKQIDYIKDLIEDYEDLLETQKDQTDYAKKVADQQKEINKLEKQYRAIQNDTSEEGATKRQKLRDQINEKRQDLKDTQEDRRISETKDMLSDFQESFEQFLEDKLKDVEGIVRQVIDRTNANGTIINDTIAALANSYGYTPSNTLKDTLSNLSNNLVSYFSSAFDNDKVNSIVHGVDAIVKYYEEAQAESEAKGQASVNKAMAQQIKETGTHIQSYTDKNGDKQTGFFDSEGKLKENYTGFAQKDGKQYLFTNGSISKKNQWYTDKAGKKYYLDKSGATKTGWQTIEGKKYYLNPKQKGAALTGWQTIDKKRYYFDANGRMYKGLKTIGKKKYYFDSNGVLLKGTWRKISNKQYYLDKKDGHVLTGKQTIDGKKYTFNADGTLKKKGWKKGTASVPKTGMAWTNEGHKSEAVIRKSDGAILTPLNKGDSVIPNSAMKNMYRALTDPEKYLKQYTTPDVKIIQGTGSTNNQSPTINMQFIANGVQDANKFVNDLMNNKKLEKWIQEVTLGQANGHSSYKKYSYAIR